MTKKDKREIEKLDKQILSLIMERASVFAEYLKKRRVGGLSLSSGEIEGEIWQQWHKKIKGKKINSRILRNIYNYINHLSYDLAEREEERNFLLSPIRKPVSIEYSAPIDSLLTRMLLFLSSSLNFSISLKRVVLNDGLYEILKVLNSVGANFKWSRDSVERSKGDSLEFDGEALFVGGDLLNLYLLLFYSLSHPCICKFTGEASLRMADLKPLIDLLPQLGARIVPFIPGSYGLPVRVEATGSISDEIQIKENVPEDMLAALILTSPLFSTSSTITLKMQHLPSPSWMKRILWIYEFVGLSYELKDKTLTVWPPSNEIQLPQRAIPLDIELASYLLSMPFILGGRAEIKGALSGCFPEEEAFKELLCCFGELEVHPDKMESSFTSTNSVEKIDVKKDKKLLPLAWALMVSRGKDGASLTNIPKEEIAPLLEICENLGLRVEKKDTEVAFYGLPLKNKSIPPLNSPSPRWSLALSLVAAGGCDIVLDNPGEITALWPSYWPLYRSLPEIKDREEKREESKNEGRKRRRILVSGNKKIG